MDLYVFGGARARRGIAVYHSMEVCPLALRGGSGRRIGQLLDRTAERNGFSLATVAPAEYVCRNRDDRRVGVYVQTAYGVGALPFDCRADSTVYLFRRERPEISNPFLAIFAKASKTIEYSQKKRKCIWIIKNHITFWKLSIHKNIRTNEIR